MGKVVAQGLSGGTGGSRIVCSSVGCVLCCCGGEGEEVGGAPGSCCRVGAALVGYVGVLAGALGGCSSDRVGGRACVRALW